MPIEFSSDDDTDDVWPVMREAIDVLPHARVWAVLTLGRDGMPCYYTNDHTALLHLLQATQIRLEAEMEEAIMRGMYGDPEEDADDE